MFVEAAKELLELLKIQKSLFSEDKINNEVQNLISNNKFFGVDISEVIKKDAKNRKRIEDQIVKVKTMYALQMVNGSALTSTAPKNTFSPSIAPMQPQLQSMIPFELFAKFGPLTEAVTTSGLLQKVFDSHKTYLGDKEVTNEGLLKCVREIVNSKELEVMFSKVDIKTLMESLNVMDLLSVSQKFMGGIGK